jgi:purine-binding chemotaxis protein CheW
VPLAETAPAHPSLATARPETLLVFRLAGERFALPVTDVAEVIDPIPATVVPHAPAFARALVNVRGVITPLIDLRRRLGIPPAAASATSRLVVLDITLDGAPQRVAIEADAVETVMETDLAALDPLPELASRWPQALVQGVCRDDGGTVILLAAETLFAADGIAA